MPLSEAAALADPTADCQQPQPHPDPDTKTPTKTRRPPSDKPESFESVVSEADAYHERPLNEKPIKPTAVKRERL